MKSHFPGVEVALIKYIKFKKNKDTFIINSVITWPNTT